MDVRFAAEVQKVQKGSEGVESPPLAAIFITSLNQPALWTEPIGQCIST